MIRKEANCALISCRKPFYNKDYRQEFCSRSCASIASNLKRLENPDYVEANKKQLQELAKTQNGPAWSEKIGKCKRRKRDILPDNIMGCSSRTRVKILKRLDAKCCICGWQKAACDIHHINGRKIDDPHNHTNITVLCPNHHREYHSGFIKPNEVKSFEEVYGKRWLEVYYS